MNKLTISIFSVLVASISVVSYPQIINSNEIINNTSSAKAIFAAAYNNRYTWERDFPGYTATVSANYAGREERGTVTVYPNFEVEVKGIADREIAELVEGPVRFVKKLTNG